MVRNENDICPFCGGRLQSRGRVKRVIRDEKGNKKTISIARFSCTQCGRWHRVLPDEYIAYKQYGKEVIEKSVAKGVDEYGEGPCELTVKRWRNKYN